MSGCYGEPNLNSSYIVTSLEKNTVVEDKTTTDDENKKDDEETKADDEFKITNDVIIYAFKGDSTSLHVDSYDLAFHGKAKQKNNDDNIVDYNKISKLNANRQIIDNITFSPAMFVWCDTVNKIYASNSIDFIAGLDSVRVNIKFDISKIGKDMTIKYEKWLIRR